MIKARKTRIATGASFRVALNRNPVATAEKKRDSQEIISESKESNCQCNLWALVIQYRV